MQIINKIDKLISQLTDLKPEMSDDLSINEKKFNDLLKSAVESSYEITGLASESASSPKASVSNGMPNWVDQKYDYYTQSPRKPNMRELMEAISGKSIDELYLGSEESWQKISDQASEMLYGVIGSNLDTRDWTSIMSSDDILKAAKEQTAIMYDPNVDILSNFDENNNLTGQTAVIKDKEGNILRSIPDSLTLAEETLLNFGATKKSIPANLEELINPEKFDDDLLGFLKNFDNSPTSIQQVVVQSASEVIANKISHEIPLDELAKL